MKQEDKEIYNTLIEQRSWWEKQVREDQMRVDNSKIELARCNRLIKIFQKAMGE